MIESYAYYCSISGQSFNPTHLLNNSNIVVDRFHKVGDLGLSGKYKGKPYDFENLIFSDESNDLDCFLDILHLKNIKNEILSAENKVLHIELSYKNQCNWEFSSSELKKINQLGLTLTISCDEAEK